MASHRVIQEPRIIHFVDLLTVLGFGILYWILCIQSADGVETWNLQNSVEGFMGLEVAFITSAHIPLARTQSYDHTWLQGRLGNVVQLAPRRQKKWVGKQLVSDIPSLKFCSWT